MKPEDIIKFFHSLFASIGNLFKDYATVILGVSSLFIPSILSKWLNKNKEKIEEKKLKVDIDNSIVESANRLNKFWQDYAEGLNKKYSDLTKECEISESKIKEQDKLIIKTDIYIEMIEEIKSELASLEDVNSEVNKLKLLTLLNRLQDAKNPKA